MSWATCYSGSNNIHNDFPPLMSDGRHFTNWLHGSNINEIIKKTHNFQDNNDYRRYLTANTENIINNNRNDAYKNCCSYLISYQSTPKTYPYLYTSSSDSSQPFGYTNTDLKKLYLSREQLNDNKITPFITQEALNKM